MTDQRNYRFKGAWRGSTRREVLAAWGYSCALCRWPGSDGHGRGLHQAHLVPWPLGPDDKSNLVPLCAPCHRRFDAGRVQGVGGAGAAVARRDGCLDTPGSKEPFALRAGTVPWSRAFAAEFRVFWSPVCRRSVTVRPRSSAIPASRQRLGRVGERRNGRGWFLQHERGHRDGPAPGQPNDAGRAVGRPRSDVSSARSSVAASVPLVSAEGEVAAAPGAH